MKKKELMNLLEIEGWEEFQYYEQFLLLMEHYNQIEEDIFVEAVFQISIDEIASFIEMYFDDMITGIPEDHMDLYKIFSTVKSILMAIATDANNDKRIANNLIHELVRFQSWVMEENRVRCIDLLDHTEEEVSIYEAFILFRLERLNEGKFEFHFPEDISYQIEEYENNDAYVFSEDDVLDGKSDEEHYLIDSENPVIITINE